jgi:hypothetical protein
MIRDIIMSAAGQSITPQPAILIPFRLPIYVNDGGFTGHYSGSNSKLLYSQNAASYNNITGNPLLTATYVGAGFLVEQSDTTGIEFNGDWTGQKFVTTGATSTNGQTWIANTSTPHREDFVVYSPEKDTLISSTHNTPSGWKGLIVSTDQGATWTVSFDGGSYTSSGFTFSKYSFGRPIWNGFEFLILAYNSATSKLQAFKSATGSSWTISNIVESTGTLTGTYIPAGTTSKSWSYSAPVWTGSKYVIAGNYTIIYTGYFEDYSVIWTSTDGITWTRKLWAVTPSNNSGGLSVISYSETYDRLVAGGYFYVASDQKYYTSDDSGATWTARTPSLVSNKLIEFNAIKWYKHLNLFVAVMTNTPSSTPSYVAATSADGLSWTTYSITVPTGLPAPVGPARMSIGLI